MDSGFLVKMVIALSLNTFWKPKYSKLTLSLNQNQKVVTSSFEKFRYTLLKLTLSSYFINNTLTVVTLLCLGLTVEIMPPNPSLHSTGLQHLLPDSCSVKISMKEPENSLSISPKIFGWKLTKDSNWKTGFSSWCLTLSWAPVEMFIVYSECALMFQSIYWTWYLLKVTITDSALITRVMSAKLYLGANSMLISLPLIYWDFLSFPILFTCWRITAGNVLNLCPAPFPPQLGGLQSLENICKYIHVYCTL